MPVKAEGLREQKCKNVLKLRSPPTGMDFYNGILTVTHKSGEICTFNTETDERRVLAREKTAVTAICRVEGILLLGTRKGEIKSLSDKKTKRLSKKHKGQIVSIDVARTEKGEIEIITASADSRINLWKLDILELNGKKIIHLLFIKSLYGPSTPVISSSLSPSRRLFLCTSELSEVIRIFKLEKDTQLVFKIEEQAVLGVFISNDRFIVVSNTNTIYLFTVDDSAPVDSLQLKENDGFPSSISTVKTRKNTFSLGLTNGKVFTGEAGDKIKIVSSILVDGIPNSIISDGDKIFVAGGKEEKHSRFFISKSSANGIFEYGLLTV